MPNKQNTLDFIRDLLDDWTTTAWMASDDRGYQTMTLDQKIADREAKFREIEEAIILHGDPVARPPFGELPVTLKADWFLQTNDELEK